VKVPRARRDALAVVLVTPLLFAVYLATLAPSITWRNGGTDSGDVATAAAVLGIPHPPGYPLFTLVGHLAVLALPSLDPARAVGLLSALLAAAAAAVTARAATELCIDQGVEAPTAMVAGSAAALTLALGSLWWRQADLPTAHAANLLFAALLTWIAVRLLQPAGCGPRPLLVGFVAGLAASHHLTLLALVPALGLGLRARGARPDGRALGLAAAGGLLGLTPWLALPLIAARQPRYLWGDPTSVGGWIELIVGRDYWSLVGSPTPFEAGGRLATAVWLLATELGPFGVPLALVGGALLWERVRGSYVAFATSLAALDGAFFAFYAARDVESYLLPSVVALGPLAALGGASALGWARARLGDGRRALVFGGLPPLAALALNLGAANLSGDREAIDYARRTLADAPARAVLVSDDDRPTFALWYASTALGLRPDVAVVDSRFMAFDWYRQLLARRYPDATVEDEVTGLVESRRPVVPAPPPR